MRNRSLEEEKSDKKKQINSATAALDEMLARMGQTKTPKDVLINMRKPQFTRLGDVKSGFNENHDQKTDVNMMPAKSVLSSSVFNMELPS